MRFHWPTHKGIQIFQSYLGNALKMGIRIAEVSDNKGKIFQWIIFEWRIIFHYTNIYQKHSILHVLYSLGVKHQRKYKCSYSHCPWNNYKNNTDWGLYNNIHGNCSACRERCSEDLNCQGIECGVFVKNAYCSWWRGMSFSQMDEKTMSSENIITCMKILAGNWICM